MNSASSTRLLSGGAVASAVAASVCCFGPLVLAVLGLGGGALLLKLEPYRPFSLAAAALFLGAAFSLAYRRRPTEECGGSACAVPSSRRGQRTMLWIVAAIVALAAAFPYLSRWLF